MDNTFSLAPGCRLGEEESIPLGSAKNGSTDVFEKGTLTNCSVSMESPVSGPYIHSLTGSSNTNNAPS